MFHVKHLAGRAEPTRCRLDWLKAHCPLMRYARRNPHDAGLGGAYPSYGDVRPARRQSKALTPATPMNDHRRMTGNSGVGRAVRSPPVDSLASR